MGSWIDAIDTVLCDLDGVVWLAHHPIAGSVEAIETIRASGLRVVFVTNNSFALRDEHEQALSSIGIAAADVVSSSMAAAHLLEPGERVLVAGGPGVAEAVRERGAEAVINTGTAIDGPIDAVVVGMHREFDYDRLAVAADTVRRGARLIGTNSDSTYPTPTGLLPGGGSILAAVSAASGAMPIVAGKPEQPMADLVASIIEQRGESVAAAALMVGDRPETDGLFAGRLGCRFALVRSGVTSPDASLSVAPGLAVDLDVADLAEVARQLVATRHGDQ